MPRYTIPAAALAAGAILTLCGTAYAQSNPKAGPSAPQNSKSHGQDKGHTENKNKSHNHENKHRSDKSSKDGRGKSAGKDRSHKDTPDHKGRHDSKMGKDKSSRKGAHDTKGRHDSKTGKGDSSRRGRSDKDAHDNRGRHDSKTGKDHLSDGRRSEHAGYPRLQGIGGRNGKYFESKRIARYNGERHYHQDRVFDKHYHEKYGNQFRYYCGGQVCHGCWYSGRYHYHWDYCCWNSYYKHWFCYDGCTGGYYYYCRSHDCYFPVECGCSTCLATPDDEFVLPCDEDVEDDSSCDEGCDESASCSEDEDDSDCEDCPRHRRVIVEIDEDE